MPFVDHSNHGWQAFLPGHDVDVQVADPLESARGRTRGLWCPMAPLPLAQAVQQSTDATSGHRIISLKEADAHAHHN